MHFIYYINRSIATNVDSTYFGLLANTTPRICLVASGGREPLTFRSLSAFPLHHILSTITILIMIHYADNHLIVLAEYKYLQNKITKDKLRIT